MAGSTKGVLSNNMPRYPFKGPSSVKNCFWLEQFHIDQTSISVDVVDAGVMFLSTNPRAVVLSTCIGVGGCWCPISIKVVLAGMACLEFRKSAPISASAANDITFFKLFTMFSTAPLSHKQTKSQKNLSIKACQTLKSCQQYQCLPHCTTH